MAEIILNCGLPRLSFGRCSEESALFFGTFGILRRTCSVPFFEPSSLPDCTRHPGRGKAVLSSSIAQLANPKQFAAFVKSLFKQQWVVYAKPAFGAPTLVLRYLGRYTHRVALSNHRLLFFDGERVTFRWKNGKVCGRSTRPLVRLYLCLRPLGGRLR